jgi:hypothetical protein
MSLKSVSIAILLAAAFALPSRAALLISEVLFNEVGSDTTGEWIEIFNDTGAAIDLSNYKIGDEETSGSTSLTEALYQFPAGASIGPGQVQVIAVSATRFNTVYGFMPTYETAAAEAGVPDMTVYATWDTDGGQVNMSNTNDQAVLVDPTDTVIDATSWGNTFAFNPAVDITGNVDGQSIYRTNPYGDTNTAGDWALYSSNAAPAAQRSTPGVLVPEPVSIVLALAISFAWGVVRRRG